MAKLKVWDLEHSLRQFALLQRGRYDAWTMLGNDYPKRHPKKEALYRWNGWVDRDAKFYACPSWGHSELAEDMCRLARIKPVELKNEFNDGQQSLERHGWLKISSGQVLFLQYVAAKSGPEYKEFRRPSRAQSDFVMLYLSKRKSKAQLEQWVEEWES